MKSSSETAGTIRVFVAKAATCGNAQSAGYMYNERATNGGEHRAREHERSEGVDDVMCGNR